MSAKASTKRTRRPRAYSLDNCIVRWGGGVSKRQAQLALKLPALGSIAKRVRLIKSFTFSRVLYLEINRFDWEQPQTVCMRLLPTMRPNWFKHRVRVLQS